MTSNNPIDFINWFNRFQLAHCKISIMPNEIIVWMEHQKISAHLTCSWINFPNHKKTEFWADLNQIWLSIKWILRWGFTNASKLNGIFFVMWSILLNLQIEIQIDSNYPIRKREMFSKHETRNWFYKIKFENFYEKRF